MKKILIILIALLCSLTLTSCEYLEYIQNLTVVTTEDPFVEIDYFKVTYYKYSVENEKYNIGYLEFLWDEENIPYNIRWMVGVIDQIIPSYNNEKVQIVQYYYDTKNKRMKAVLLKDNKEFITKINYNTIIEPFHNINPNKYKLDDDVYCDVAYQVKEKAEN